MDLTRRAAAGEEHEEGDDQRSSLSRFDILALVGLLLLSAGAFWIYAPAGLVVPGVVLLWFGFWGAE